MREQGFEYVSVGRPVASAPRVVREVANG